MSLVYVFAEHNWVELLRLAVEMGLQVAFMEERYRHPLIAASVYGHGGAVRLLLGTTGHGLTVP